MCLYSCLHLLNAYLLRYGKTMIVFCILLNHWTCFIPRLIMVVERLVFNTYSIKIIITENLIRMSYTVCV